MEKSSFLNIQFFTSHIQDGIYTNFTEKGVTLLLFKDARVDQKLLDETFTPFGWKRSYQVIGGNLYCTVEVWDKEKNR